MKVANGKIIAVVAVKDLSEAKKFYGETLGLKEVHGDEYGVAYEAGGGQLFVYTSEENAGTNKATGFAIEVDDIEGVVDELKEKGVKFEHYEGLGELKGDIHVMGTMKAAWLKDPSGNIISLDNNSK